MNSQDFLGGVLGPVSAAYEPGRTNNAVLRIVTSPLSSKLGDVAGDTLRLALAGFSLPKNETAPVMVPYLNEMRKFAGQTTFDDISVSFHDYVTAAVAKVLWKWRYLIHDPTTGLRGLKVNYALNGTIEQFAPDGGLPRIYNVEGIWPMSLDCGDIEMGADEPLRIQVRFSCDKVYPAPDYVPTGSGVAFGASSASVTTP